MSMQLIMMCVVVALACCTMALICAILAIAGERYRLMFEILTKAALFFGFLAALALMAALLIATVEGVRWTSG